MPTALAISPHLDDAVFSAGGLLARLSQKGWRVVVATVFTASVPNPTGFALACQIDKGLAPDVDYMALRRDEDAAACRIIGAEPIQLPFLEAPHRGYGSPEALFAGMREGDGIIEAVTPALADLVDQLMPDMLLAPQAIGAHVDHVAVHRALRECAPSIVFWADFPYAVRPVLRPNPFGDDVGRWPQKTVALTSCEARLKGDAATAYASQLDFQFGGASAAMATILSQGAVESFSVADDCNVTSDIEKHMHSFSG